MARLVIRAGSPVSTPQYLLRYIPYFPGPQPSSPDFRTYYPWPHRPLCLICTTCIGVVVGWYEVSILVCVIWHISMSLTSYIYTPNSIQIYTLWHSGVGGMSPLHTPYDIYHLFRCNTAIPCIAYILPLHNIQSLSIWNTGTWYTLYSNILYGLCLLVIFHIADTWIA